MDSFFVKFIMWGILTALAYHVVVGIRHLMMDFGYRTKPRSRETFRQNFFVITVVLSLLASPRMVTTPQHWDATAYMTFIWSVLPPSF